MKIHALRLKPGQDLKAEIINFVREHEIRAWCILACVGWLDKVTLRVSGGEIMTFEKKLEIVSIMGTLSQDDCHIHISLADIDYGVIWGHLKDWSSVYSTAELVLAEFEDFVFLRKLDEETGFAELNIQLNKTDW